MSIKLKNITKELLEEEHNKQLLVEEMKLYFACTEKYKGIKDNFYCIKYGNLNNCGRYKTIGSFSKKWEGINKFDDGQAWRSGGVNKPVIPVEGEFGVILEIFEENSFFELYFEWIDTQYNNTMGVLVYIGTFDCGDNNNLKFKNIKLSKVSVIDSSNPTRYEEGIKEVRADGVGNSLVKNFFKNILQHTKNLKLGNPKDLTGDEMKNDIDEIMTQK